MLIRFAKNESDMKQISIIHETVLRDSFLASLGNKFLEKFYKSTLNNENMATVVVVDEDKIIGFATFGTQLGTILKTTFAKIFKETLFALAKNPSILFKLISIPFYPSFKDKAKFAEIFSLAVLPQYQGKGIGKSLLNYCKNELNKRGYNNFIISVRSSMEANNFYRKIGLTKVKSTKFLGENINFWQGEC